MATPITTPTPTTPSGRVKRSLIQSIVALVPAVVVLLNANHVSLTSASKYGGTSVAAVLAIAMLQNFAESKGWIKSA